MNDYKHILMGNIEKKNFNFIFLLFFLIAGFGVWWLLFKGIQTGGIYVGLITFVVSMLFFIFTFQKEESNIFSFVVPLNKSNIRAVMMFFAGFFLWLGLLILPRITGFSINTNVMAPLGSVAGVTGNNVYNLLSVTGDSFWQFFITGWVAPVIEEIILAMGLVLLGVFVAYCIRKLIHIKYDMSKYRKFDIIVGFLFSMVFFTILHQFNQSYVDDPRLFIFAFVFRLVLNMLIYGFFFIGSIKSYLGLMFGIGVHMANNWVAMGWNKVSDGLFTANGAWILVLFLLLIIFLIFSIGRKET